MPRSLAICAIGRPLSSTSRTARSRSSSGYFFGAGIVETVPLPRMKSWLGGLRQTRPDSLRRESSVERLLIRDHGVRLEYCDNGQRLLPPLTGEFRERNAIDDRAQLHAFAVACCGPRARQLLEERRVERSGDTVDVGRIGPSRGLGRVPFA